MNRSLILLIVIVVVLGFASTTFLYTVDETEQVVITRFGKPIRTVKDPGLHLKTPFVDAVNVFEKRVLPWDGKPDQIPTADKKYIFVDTFARWRIVDPLKFFRSVNNERGARLRLSDIIDGATRDVISRHPLVEVVRNSNRELPRDEEEEALGVISEIGDVSLGRLKISAMIFEKAREKIEESFGIELLDVQVEKINYVREVREKVFERMISERKRIAELFRSEGQRNLQEISGLREKELKRIESQAYLKAQRIRGKADAEAAAIYAGAYGRDPEFFQFTRSLQTYRNTLTGKSTLLLSTDSDYLKYLKNSSPRR
ncbi:MAG: protease modulator HflC [Acidobacteriota bacterium]